MNKIRLFLLLVAPVISIVASAQQVKPTFKKLTYVPYFLELRGKDTVHLIRDRLDINENGQAEYTITYYTRPVHTYDTTYQLPDTLIAKLNKIFNAKSNLESFRISDKQPNGFAYKGQLIFISFTDLKGKSHNYIDAWPYMSKEFNAALKATIHHAKIRTDKAFVFDDKILVSLIIKTQEACKYCEKIERPSDEPPTVQHLEITAPGVKH